MPSVLLIIADDWSPIAGCYGNAIVRTPHIDALAKRATVFGRAFCTTPTCAASRACLLTGHHSHQHGQYGLCHGVHGFRTHEKYASRSLPAILNRAGVFTGIVGKSHVEPAHVYPFTMAQKGTTASNQSLLALAKRFLSQAGDRPFYLHVGSFYPHRTRGGFDPSLLASEFGDTDQTYSPAEVIVPPWMHDSSAVRQELAGYYTYISRLDQLVGMLAAELGNAGRLHDTAIILMSDHGMPFPTAKASSYEAGHHCPLIVAPPESQGNAVRSQAMVNWCDLYPTIAGLLGIPTSDLPGDLPGRSLLPILHEPDPAGWDHTFYAHNFHGVTEYHPYRVLRERRYKFVHHLVRGLSMPIPENLLRSPAWQEPRMQGSSHAGPRRMADILHHEPEELHDLQDDPLETANLIHQPGFAHIASRMRQALLQFRLRTGDPWLALDRRDGLLEAGSAQDG